MKMFLIRTAYISTIILTLAYIWTRPNEGALTLYETQSELIEFSDTALSDKAEDHFNRIFLSSKYFAAFAIHPEGHYNWSTGLHNIDDARSEALARCNKGASGCEIYAELRPIGFNVKYVGNTISENVAKKKITKFFPRKGTILYTLGNDGSWTIQTSKDGVYIPEIYIRYRCMKNQYKKYRPIFLPRMKCKLYQGPVYSVKE